MQNVSCKTCLLLSLKSTEFKIFVDKQFVFMTICQIVYKVFGFMFL